MELHTIGIDLGKTVFHLVGLNLRGEVVVRKKVGRRLDAIPGIGPLTATALALNRRQAKAARHQQAREL
jgi:hypothetical protein